ncbi:universal stress protein [Dyella sp. RRB7]|uniref:universal stress protein n=1 Tax=Dyella sp. RRB7 TaxID=2919502 RepID=UPI001FAA1F5A|nr:universal stress protein [Dyella sp. RRB7]
MCDILVNCESFKHWSPAVDYAARLAATVEAALTGIFVCPSPSSLVTPYEAPELITELMEASRELEEHASRAEASFLAFAHERGVTRAAWQMAEENVPRALELAGNWHDLLVLGRGTQGSWGLPSAVGSLVLGTHMPCIVVPPEGATSTLDRVAVAWNGSSEAIGAIHAALPLLARARQVVVLHGQQRPSASMSAWKPPFDLSNYLARHAIRHEFLMLSEPDELIGGALLNAAADVEANLLVMGAYGHTRFSEWILGGATRTALEKAAIPVLMRH